MKKMRDGNELWYIEILLSWAQFPVSIGHLYTFFSKESFEMLLIGLMLFLFSICSSLYSVGIKPF